MGDFFVTVGGEKYTLRKEILADHSGFFRHLFRFDPFGLVGSYRTFAPRQTEENFPDDHLISRNKDLWEDAIEEWHHGRSHRCRDLFLPQAWAEHQRRKEFYEYLSMLPLNVRYCFGVKERFLPLMSIVYHVGDDRIEGSVRTHETEGIGQQSGPARTHETEGIDQRSGPVRTHETDLSQRRSYQAVTTTGIFKPPMNETCFQVMQEMNRIIATRTRIESDPITYFALVDWAPDSPKERRLVVWVNDQHELCWIPSKAGEGEAFWMIDISNVVNLILERELGSPVYLDYSNGFGH